MNDEKEGSRYLKLSDDFNQLRYGFDNIEKTKGGLKLVGKSIFNVGKFALTELLPCMVAQAAKDAENQRFYSPFAPLNSYMYSPYKHFPYHRYF